MTSTTCSSERSQCRLSNEPKILQIGQEMVEKRCLIPSLLFGLAARRVNLYRLPCFTLLPFGLCVFRSNLHRFVVIYILCYYVLSPPGLGEMLSQEKLIKQGAEGKIYETTFMGRPCLAKVRFKKAYRHPILDEKLTQRRLTQECRAIQKSRSLGVRTPTVYFVDQITSTIYLEYLQDSTVLKDFIDQNPASVVTACEAVGRELGKLHSGDLIHGDLTTSNILIRDDGTPVIIDFGLSTTSSLVEDKGVDLYVLEKAFLSTHPKCEGLLEAIWVGYKKSYSSHKKIFVKLDEIRLRGRKRSMVG
eukprot:sb/3467255/